MLLVGTGQWKEFNLLLPVHEVNMPQYWLRQSTEGLWLVIADLVPPCGLHLKPLLMRGGYLSNEYHKAVPCIRVALLHHLNE